MRLTVNQYARALYDSTNNKSENDVSSVISNFLKLLRKNKQLKLAEKIIEKFSEIWNGEYEISEVKIRSRETLDTETKNKIREFILKKYKAKEVSLKEEIDEQMGGGITLQVRDDLIDASVSKMIINLKRELIK